MPATRPNTVRCAVTSRSVLSENEHGGDVAASNNFSANRAFIQWAGFTFGRAQSFFDFYSNPATSYWGAFPGSDTGDGGWFVMGYTAQFGNGLSGTIAVEAPRKTLIIDGTLPSTVASVSSTNYGGFQAPDVVANLRIDQAWGSAQIMGALHDVNATYYTGVGASAASLGSGHPDDKVGWVIGGGIKLNAPFIGQGDYFQAQVNYTQGALRYVFQTSQPSWSINDTGNSAGFGIMSRRCLQRHDHGVGINAATSLELTTAWNVNAAYEHFWNPRWRTSLYGGYAQVSYSSNANSILCGFGTNGVVNNGCDSDWQTWWVGSRTQWNVTKDFYMGVDVMYSRLDSATASVSPTLGALAISPNLGARCRKWTPTTGRSASACTAISIPDRVIMGV